MRVVLDTNILISALLAPLGPPGVIYRAWVDGAFTLLLSVEQMEELRETLAKPKLAARIRPYRAGRMVNELKKFGDVLESLPIVKLSSDPDDDMLLAMAEAGKADYLVTGDKVGLLSFVRYGGARIITAREFLRLGWFSGNLR